MKKTSPPRTRSTGIQIRDLQLIDIPKVVDLGEKVFNEDTLPLLHRTWDETEVLNNYSTDAEFCLIATNGKTIVGFALASLMEKAGANERQSIYGWLHWIGVSPRHRGKGIAQTLIDELTNRLKAVGAQFLLADSDESNNDALNFFTQSGFNAKTRHVFFAKDI